MRRENEYCLNFLNFKPKDMKRSEIAKRINKVFPSKLRSMAGFFGIFSRDVSKEDDDVTEDLFSFRSGLEMAGVGL